MYRQCYLYDLTLLAKRFYSEETIVKFREDSVLRQEAKRRESTVQDDQENFQVPSFEPAPAVPSYPWRQGNTRSDQEEGRSTEMAIVGDQPRGQNRAKGQKSKEKRLKWLPRGWCELLPSGRPPDE